MRSRNLKLKDFFPLKTESLDLTNGNSFRTNYHTKTDSKVSEIYLNSKTIKQKAESIKRKYEICSKRKPLDNFLLTSIPSYKSKTEKKLKDRKSFLKIEKEKGYKKYILHAALIILCIIVSAFVNCFMDLLSNVDTICSIHHCYMLFHNLNMIMM